MPAKATKSVKAVKTGKASKVTKASKTVKADDAQKTGKRNVPRKTTHLQIHLVDNDQLSSVENVSPKLDSLMAIELVQTAIAAIFFDIIWLRKVFPDHDWQVRDYDPSNPNNSYEAYVEGNDFVSKQHGYDHWHVPKRGEDTRVDKLMDTLESCAKEPIEKHWLKKLQLCFHSADGNDMSEANLIEAYSLTFEHYKGKVSPQLSTHGRNLPVDERPLTLLEGRQTLRDMVDKLFQVLYACDRRGRRLKNNPLPAQFRMIFLAEYNDSAPRDYQPSYFKPGNAATSTIMNLCESDDRFVMDTSYHVVSAGLLLPGPEDPLSQNSAMLSSTRSLLQAQAPVPSLDVSRPLGNGPLQYKLALGLQTATVDEGTQREAVYQLQDVGLSRGNRPATQDTQQLRQQFSTPQHSVESQLPFAPPYTQNILNHLRDRLLELTNTNRGDDLDEPQGVGYVKGDSTVKCDCGCQERYEDMIYCVECQHLQHSECYGYLDQKQPANHLCYSCLAKLYPVEKPQLDIAADLCTKRFTLRVLREQENAVSYKALAEYLGRSLEFTVSIVELLGEFGLVQLAKKDLGYTVRYVGNDETLMKEFFRPQKHINNLFAINDALNSDNHQGVNTADVRDKVNTLNASYSTPTRIENGRLPISGLSQRNTIDDGTTQGEPSPQPAVRTPIHLVNSHHLRSIARRGLKLGQGNINTPTPKRHAEFNTPMEATKRMRTSQTSPFAL